uniref:Uncharacterized protein n=1 Tax=Babesia bovis TaxID=5865 RepID=S6C7U0_BABBO|nr:hypothetical protein [Babesia bovis]
MYIYVDTTLLPYANVIQHLHVRTSTYRAQVKICIGTLAVHTLKNLSHGLRVKLVIDISVIYLHRVHHHVLPTMANVIKHLHVRYKHVTRFINNSLDFWVDNFDNLFGVRKRHNAVLPVQPTPPPKVCYNNNLG